MSPLDMLVWKARFHRLTAAGWRRLEREKNNGNEFAAVVAAILNTVGEAR